MQFEIPVYQRKYDWRVENCDQLFADLVKLLESKRPNHFFGSIVSAAADAYGRNRLIIDGQQRLTTISLLLLAGIKAVENKELEVSSQKRLDEARETYLFAKYCTAERKIKLIPIEDDLKAYDKIVNNEPLDEGSKMTKNFRHFYDLLTRKPHRLSFDGLLDAIERLQIITIELDEKDDAQLIFESLNSTGLALEEADKIRNYLLMSLPAEEQRFCFNEYWHKIEEATDGKPTMFLRDYLTIKQQLQRPIRLSNMYPEWKRYMEGKERKDEMKEMVDYAKFYHQATKASLPTSKLSEKMQHICNLETDVANVFFIQFFKYASGNDLPEGETYKVIDLVENYMARRIVCNMPGNALTQVFCALHRDVLKSMEEYANAGQPTSCKYSDILAYHIMRRDGNYQLPRDVQFMEAIKTRDAYHMLKPFQIFLFERLENSVSGEYNDVVSDMKKKEATIEHIMPQTLNADWVTMLGSNYEETKERYLHTFANLTLTGINGELSNKPFEIKRDGKLVGGVMYPGYKTSKYRLTRSVTLCNRWTSVELEQRSQEMVNVFLRLYPLPATTFKPLPKPVDEISLEDDTFSPTNRQLKGFRLYGKEHMEDTWKSMMLKVIAIVAERHPDVVDSLYDKECYFWTSKSSSDLRYCSQVAQDKYIWTSMDNKSKLRCLRYLFDKCDIADSELVLLLEPVATANVNKDNQS